MIKEKPVLSIVTPTYNRGILLKRCFQSLCEQTNHNFEWIIVDDGSADDTKWIVQEFNKETIPFNIVYVWKENEGKHTALNESHSYIHGQYVLILDSDDILTSNAVETVLINWEKYDRNPDIGMVTFLKGETIDRPNAYAKDEHIPVDVIRYKRICVRSSDCCEVLRSELFKEFPFVKFENEKFLAETALWYRVGKKCKCVYVNKVIYLCEYLEGGLTKSGREMRINNPQGGMYTSYLRMDKQCFTSERIRAALLYVCYAYFAHKDVNEILRKAKPYRGLTIACLIPGAMMYVLWKKRYLK